MDKSHPLSTPMVVRSLDVKKDPYRPKEENEEILAFSVNLLTRFSSTPTFRHWIEIKHIFRYLRGTIDMGLFYSYDLLNHPHLVGYTNSGYLSDPHKGHS